MGKLVRRLTYSRVVSTVALFLALGGGAYALSLGKGDVTSRIIKNDTIRSADVKRDSLKGSDIREESLKVAAAGSLPAPASCDPSGAVPVNCAATSIRMPMQGRLLVIATGQFDAVTAEGRGHCLVFVDTGQIAETPAVTPGDEAFSVAGVSRTLPAGTHSVELRCLEGSGDARVEVTGLAAVAVGG